MDKEIKIRVINKTTGEFFEVTMEELMMIRENCSEEEVKE